MLKKNLTQSFRLAGLLLIALLAIAYVSPADAAFMSCREDPILRFSDGTVLLVTVQVGTDASNVNSINYTVHVPVGVELVQKTYTPMKGFQGTQDVIWVPDAQPDEYATDVVVNTNGDKVPVTVTSRLRSQSVSVDGFNGEHLKATLTK